MKKSLYFILFAALLAQIPSEVMGMKREANEQSGPEKKRSEVETTTQDTDYALIGRLGQQILGPQEVATQAPQPEQPKQDDPETAVTAQASAVIPDVVTTEESKAFNVVIPGTNDTKLVNGLLQALPPALRQQFKIIELRLISNDEKLSDLCEGQAGVKTSQKRLEAGQERLEDAIEAVSANQAEASEQLTRVEDGTAQNGQQLTSLNVLIVAVQGDVNALNRQVDGLDRRSTEMGQQLIQLNERVRTGFERAVNDSQEIHRHIDRLVRITNGAPITLLLVVATATGLPLYMFRGLLTAGLGTTVMVLATNQAYPLFMQISQNPAVQFIWRLFRAAEAVAAVVPAQEQVPAPAQVQAAAPAAVQPAAAPALAPTSQARSRFGSVGRYFRRK